MTFRRCMAQAALECRRGHSALSAWRGWRRHGSACGQTPRIVASSAWFRGPLYHEDVIVAGAGIIGLTCAWRIALTGFPVTIFDSGEPARQASWAAAGMLAPGGEFCANSALAQMALRSAAQY